METASSFVKQVDKDQESSLNAVWITLTAILFTALVTFYFKVVKKDKRIAHYIDQLPGPTPVPVLGNALEFLLPNHELVHLLNRFVATYGRTLRIWLTNQAYVLFCSANDVEKVLSSNIHIEKSQDYDMLHAWLGRGLLTSAGKKWFTRRKLLTPAFHFKILEDFLDVFNEQSSVLVEVLERDCAGGKVFNMFPYITRCALDIISETAMGKKINAQTEKDSEYVRAIYGIAELIIQRILRPWLRPPLVWKMLPEGREEKRLLKILHGFTEQVIKERKEERAKQGNPKIETESDPDGIHMTKKRRLAFMDLLLDVSDNGRVLSDLDIREETDTFMFEGHDTTAANLNWTLFLLATYPEFQTRVHEELDKIFEDGKTKPVTMADMTQMKYLECCVKEALRMYPSVPFFTRELKEDCDIGEGRMVPAGTVAFISTWNLHRDPNVFPDPDVFNPDRFLPENSTGRSPYAYVPFSAGPRNCIGQKFALMEEKVMLSWVLRNYRVEPAEKLEELEIVPDLILRPKNGLKVKMFKRT